MTHLDDAKNQMKPQPGEPPEGWITPPDFDVAFDALQAAWREDDQALATHVSTTGTATTAAIATKADQSALDGVSKRVTDGLAAEAQARASAISGAAAALHNDLTAGLADKVDKSVKVVAGDGLTGGGALTADVSVGVKAGGIGTAMLGDRVVTARTSALTAADVGAAPAGITVANGTVTLDRGKPLLVVHPASGATVPVLLPPAAQAEGITYTVVNDGDGTLDFPAQPHWAMPGKGHLLIYAAGGTWHVIGGEHSDRTVGLRIRTWDTAEGRWHTTVADTGWRNLESLATANSGQNLSRLWLNRERDRVTWLVQVASTATTKQTLLPALPSGFGPVAWMVHRWSVPRGTAQDLALFEAINGTGLTYLVPSGSTWWASLQYMTEDAWPSALPGALISAPASRSIAPPAPGDTWDDGGVIAPVVNTPWVQP